VRFHLEWGYSWEHYRAILEVARRHCIPVFCVDCAPRNDLRYIRKRDSSVAAKVADILVRNPDHTVVVAFGESHLADNHLPAKLRAHFPDGGPGKELTILQNVDDVYWKVACSGAEDASVVKLSDNVYCVLTATPFEKYEAYRRQLEIWKAHDQDDQRLDLTSTVYNLINTIVDFIGVDRYSYCLTRDGACVEFLIDGYPEVYARDEFDLFESLLDSNEFTRAQVRQVLHHTSRQGSCYVPRINSIFVGKFSLVHGAEEAAHFVNFALKRQRYRDYRSRRLDGSGAFYLSSLEEALGYFGSKLIDPRRNHVLESPVLHWKEVDPATRRLLGVTSTQLQSMRRFVLAHKKMEIQYPSMAKVPALIAEGISSRGRAFTVLTHELGYLLGEQLYRGYLAGLMSRAEISRLFSLRFEEQGPPFEAYLDLCERSGALDLRA
jgi:hypothetical protein